MERVEGVKWISRTDSAAWDGDVASTECRAERVNVTTLVIQSMEEAFVEMADNFRIDTGPPYASAA
jgi:hypothetical protein